MIQRRKPLKRSSKPIARRARIKPVSDRRRGELAVYRLKRAAFLHDRPICGVWLKENGIEWVEPRLYRGIHSGHVWDVESLRGRGAPAATEVHHMGKRRGAALNDESKWLAVCRKNHERIEGNLAWARANGFAENF